MPLLRREFKHTADAGNINARDHFSIFEVFTKCRSGIKPWGPLRKRASWNFRQGHIQRTGEIHGLFPRLYQRGFSSRIFAVIPGRKVPRSPVNSTSTSNVPLDGSMTGLTCFTRAA